MPVLRFFGGTERTRTVIGLVDNQVPHLSATVPRLRIADLRMQIGVLLMIEYAVGSYKTNLNSALRIPHSEIDLGGSKGVEPSLAAVTVRRSAVKLRPTERFSIADW